MEKNPDDSGGCDVAATRGGVDAVGVAWGT